MMNKLKHSISKKILFMVAITFILINISLHGGISFLNKQTFYKLEGDKADIIVKNYAPMLAMGLYLDMENKVETILDQILKNDSVLKAEVYQNDISIAQKSKEELKEELKDSIVVSTPIFQPNTETKLGLLEISYSTKQFKELMQHYLLLMTYAMIAVILALVGLHKYIQNLLKPLKNLASLLKDYSPKVDMKIPYTEDKNEIGLIANALHMSYQKTREHELTLHKLNETLEDKVKEKTKELKDQLLTDRVTQLPNRVALLNDIERSDKNSALAILYLDNFKEISSFYGYEIGDKLLQMVKDRVNMVFSNLNHVLYKLPGSELVLFSECIDNKTDFLAYLTEFINTLNHNPFFIGDYEIHVTFTIGASIHEDLLLSKADIALQEAYKSKQPIMIYNSLNQIEKKIENNIQMIKKIKSAIKDDRISVFFQPIFDNKTGKIKSYESLIRLIQEDGKVLSPFFFLEISKKAKLYKQLMKIVIETSCKTFVNSPHRFSLNFEIDDILDEEMVTYTLKTAQKYDVLEQMTFEILESESIENIDAISTFTKLVSKQGCEVSIDDFGTGYSNYMHVLKLKSNYLKIDGSLIKNIHKDKDAKIIVSSIVNFAKELGLKTVAEFVHCQEVQLEIEKLGIDYSQGFFLGEPQPYLLEEAILEEA